MTIISKKVFEDVQTFVDDTDVTSCVFTGSIEGKKDLHLRETTVEETVKVAGQLFIDNQKATFSYKTCIAGKDAIIVKAHVDYLQAGSRIDLFNHSKIETGIGVGRVSIEDSAIEHLTMIADDGKVVLCLRNSQAIKKLTIRTLPMNCEIREDLYKPQTIGIDTPQHSFFSIVSGLASIKEKDSKQSLSKIFRQLMRQHSTDVNKELYFAGGVFKIADGKYICLRKPKELAPEKVCVDVNVGELDCNVEFVDCEGQIKPIAGKGFFTGKILVKGNEEEQ